MCWCIGQAVLRGSGSIQRRYKIINIPCDFHVYQRTSSWACPHTVAVLKLKPCGIPKGSLARTLWLRSLITVIPFLFGDPEGLSLKITIKVYYVKCLGLKVMIQHFCQSTWSFRTSSGIDHELCKTTSPYVSTATCLSMSILQLNGVLHIVFGWMHFTKHRKILLKATKKYYWKQLE